MTLTDLAPDDRADASAQDRLAVGQLRTLHPHPQYPCGQARTVLLVSEPRPDNLPDDIATIPGPCRTLQVVLISTDLDHASTRDLVIPTTASGLTRPAVAWLDTVSTIRLEPGDGPDRLGPSFGQVLPSAVADLAWAVIHGSHERLVDAVSDLEADPHAWDLGTHPCQPVDPCWEQRGREAQNLLHLAAWW